MGKAETDPNEYTSFGPLLRHLRQQAWMTQGGLGVAVGYSETQITRLETGSRAPDPSIVEARFVSALGLRPESAAARRLVQLAVAEHRSRSPRGINGDGLHGIPAPLPAPLTRFIGRERELAHVTALLAAHWLVTLTGTGGVGKTRLSLEAAASVSEQYSDGVALVELGPLANPALVPKAVASALGLREQTGRPALTRVCEQLRDKQLLLILDNCEHLLDACATVAEAVLRSAPRVRILANSREALGIAGETAYRVPSMPTPDPLKALTVDEAARYAAVQLFVERARAVSCDFLLSGANAAAIARICHRLDGIPLAVELAAARVEVLTPEQIASLLDDRFRLLTGGSRTALPRQHTLRATMDWSYGLLTEPERILLRRLAVFAGGWTLDAATAVCSGDGLGDSVMLDLLTRLVAKSMVVVEGGGEARFRQLETVRQYARDRLFESGEGGPLRDRHAQYFARLADEFGAHNLGLRALEWFAKMEDELDNVRAAADWLQENRDAQTVMNMVGCLGRFWMVRHPVEGLARCESVLALPESAPRTQARGRALNVYGNLLWSLARYAEAAKSLEEATAISDEFGDVLMSIGSRVTWGASMTALGDTARARSLLTEALSLARQTGSAVAVGLVQQHIGDAVMREGNLDEAQAIFEQSAANLAGSKLHNNEALTLRRLGQIAIRRGEAGRARTLLRESVRLNVEIDEWRGAVTSLAAYAAMLAAEGRDVDAARLCGAVDAYLEPQHLHLTLMLDEVFHERTVADLRAGLGPEAYTAAWQEGHAISPDQAVAFALGKQSTLVPTSLS